jgi:hypothetical protein
MPEEQETKSEELRASVAKLFQESRRLKEASDRVMQAAEELNKLIPKRRPKTDSDK